jgi:hypothetical protein
METIFTSHANLRCRQRGARPAAARAVLKFGDIEIAGYEGCRRLQLSHAAVDAMLDDGLSIAMIDAARKLALIVDESDRIVTVIKLRNSDRRRSPKSARRAKARFVCRGR